MITHLGNPQSDYNSNSANLLMYILFALENKFINWCKSIRKSISIAAGCINGIYFLCKC